MRVAAVILLVICLAVAGLTGYLYLTANVTITGIDCIAVDAADQPEVFYGLKTQMAQGVFTGTPFETAGLGEAGDYQFYTYTVQMRNETFVEGEIAQIQLAPMNGDVLQMADDQARVIPARGQGMIQAVLLTTKEMHPVRELMVTYYLWGMPFSIRTTYSR